MKTLTYTPCILTELNLPKCRERNKVKEILVSVSLKIVSVLAIVSSYYFIVKWTLLQMDFTTYLIALFGLGYCSAMGVFTIIIYSFNYRFYK